MHGDGDNTVEKIEYKILANATTGNVCINKTQYFKTFPQSPGISPSAVISQRKKWLKDHKNRQLDFDDITHYQQMINALDATAELMGERS